MYRLISVTRRHIDFLFNREETVMDTKAHLDEIARISRESGMYDEGDWQLAPTDDDHTGEDVD